MAENEQAANKSQCNTAGKRERKKVGWKRKGNGREGSMSARLSKKRQTAGRRAEKNEC